MSYWIYAWIFWRRRGEAWQVQWQSRILEVGEHVLENVFFELSPRGLGGVTQAEKGESIQER